MNLDQANTPAAAQSESHWNRREGGQKYIAVHGSAASVPRWQRNAEPNGPDSSSARHRCCVGPQALPDLMSADSTSFIETVNTHRLPGPVSNFPIAGFMSNMLYSFCGVIKTYWAYYSFLFYGKTSKQSEKQA